MVKFYDVINGNEIGTYDQANGGNGELKKINYRQPDKCHFRNWRNFLIQSLVLGPTVDTYVESH